MTDDQQNDATQADPEMVFRALRHTILEEHEREINQLRADAQAQDAVGRRVDERVRRLWEGSGVDMAAIDELRAAETASMNEYIEEVRRSAAARDPQRGPRLRKAAEHALDQIQMGGSQPYLIGADVVAATADRLTDYEGERGNPATWLYDASTPRKVKNSATGGASCTGGWVYHPFYAIWYFAWPPVAPALGKCSVQAWFAYYGYYQLLAVPLPPDYCAWAAATATATLQVYQQVTYPSKYSKLLGQSDAKFFDKSVGSASNTVSSGPVEGSGVLTADVTITSLLQTHIAVTVKVDAGAKGQPAYAEINFQDGAAHYLPAPFVIVSW